MRTNELSAAQMQALSGIDFNKIDSMVKDLVGEREKIVSDISENGPTEELISSLSEVSEKLKELYSKIEDISNEHKRNARIKAELETPPYITEEYKNDFVNAVCFGEQFKLVDTCFKSYKSKLISSTSEELFQDRKKVICKLVDFQNTSNKELFFMDAAHENKLAPIEFYVFDIPDIKCVIYLKEDNSCSVFFVGPSLTLSLTETFYKNPKYRNVAPIYHDYDPVTVGYAAKSLNEAYELIESVLGY